MVAAAFAASSAVRPTGKGQGLPCRLVYLKLNDRERESTLKNPFQSRTRLF